MLLAGVRGKHTFAGMAKDIPRQWDDLLKLGKLPGQVGKTAYGAICGGDPETQTMEYMCAVEVASFDLLGLAAELRPAICADAGFRGVRRALRRRYG
jgi:hypothetical protein